MSELQYNINQIQQALDLTVGTPSIGDAIVVSSTSPLQFDLQPGGGGGGAVNSVTGLLPILVDNTDPANPIVSVVTADTSNDGVVDTKGQSFAGLKRFVDGAQSPKIPSAADDLTNKAYVDTFAAGLQVKNAVRVATLTAGTMSTSFAAGQIVDGVTLAKDDRILIKNQGGADGTTSVDNGIYVVQISGAPLRADDYNDPGEANVGTFTSVLEGSQAATSWTQLETGTIDPGTDPMAFGQLNISANVNSIQSPLGTLTGDVTLSSKDIYYSGISGITTWDKIETKAPIDSPALTGTPTTTAPASNDNSLRIATTAFVQTFGGNNYQPLNTRLTNLANQSYTTPGNLRLIGTNTWQIDSTSYATSLALTNGLATKQNTITGAATTITSSDLTANKALISNALGKVAVSGVTDTELGYVAGVTSPIQTQLNNKSPLYMSVPANETGTTYTYVLGDANNVFKRFSNTGAITVTVPPSSSVNFSIGTQLYGIQVNTGQVTIAQGSGVTINAADATYPGTPAKTRTKYSAFMLVKVATDTWDLIGDISTI